MPETTEAVEVETVLNDAVENGGEEEELVGLDLDQLWKFLDNLVPEAQPKTEIMDCNGEVHEVPALLPARKQIVVLKELRVLTTQTVTEEMRAELASKWDDEGIFAVLDALLDLIGEEKVLGHVDRAFSVAFPKLMKHVGEDERPTDVFALEEIGGALLPFFGRLARKMMKLMA